MSDRFEDISKLVGYAKSIEDKHEGRRTIHELDHSIWRLDEYVLEELKHNSTLKKENWPTFTSNAPRTLSRVVSAMLNKNKMQIKFLIPPNATEEEENSLNANESLVMGAVYENNQIRAHRGDTSLQWDITWYIIHRGGVATIPLFTPEDKKNKYKISVYDPYECSWEKGNCCLDFFERVYYEDKETVENTWQITGIDADANGLVLCRDMWWIDRECDEPDENGVKKITKPHVVYNAVIAGDKIELKPPTAHPEFECNPAYIHRAGGNPSYVNIKNVENQNAIAEQWEGLYTGVRQTIAWINRAATFFGLYLRNGAIGPWVYQGHKNKNISESLKKPFSVIEIGAGEEFGPVSTPSMAGESKEFLAFLQNEWQKGGVTDIVFGDLPFTVSGFGMIQLRGAVEILISSFIKCTEQVYVSIAEELTKQYIKIGKKTTVKGFDNSDKLFISSIKPSEVSKDFIVQATLNEGLPTDPVAVGNAAAQWKAAGAPEKKIFEDVFNFDNAQALVEEARRERAEALPPVQLAKAIKAFQDNGDEDTAALIFEFASRSGILGGNSEQSGQGPQEMNPSESAPNPQYQPPEVRADNTEQAGNIPEQKTGRPSAGGY